MQKAQALQDVAGQLLVLRGRRKPHLQHPAFELDLDHVGEAFFDFRQLETKQAASARVSKRKTAW